MSDTADQFAFLQAWPEARHISWLTPALRPTTERRNRGIWPMAEAQSIAVRSAGAIAAIPLLEGLASAEIDRARDVNSRLCSAYMIYHCITEPPWPEMDDVTPLEARQCGAIVKAAERAEHEKLPPGSTRTFSCVIDPGRAPNYLAHAVLSLNQQSERGQRNRLAAPAEDRAMLAEAEAMELERALRASGLLA